MTTTPVTTGYAPVPGGALYYEEAGSGPAVVLIHAGIANLRMWDAQVAALAPRYRAVAFDCRGFGRTRAEPVGFSNRADVVALLDHLGIADAVLVGCSRGGQIALDTAIDHPDRVRGLVWVCSGVGGFSPPDELFPPAELALFEAMEAAEVAHDLERVAALDVRLWVDGPLQPEGRAAPAVREQVYAMSLGNYRAHGALMADPGFVAQPLEPPAAGRLAEVRAPVLAIVGDIDTSATPAAAAVLAAGVPHCRVEHFADCAHLPNMEQPARFNAMLLEFLAGL